MNVLALIKAGEGDAPALAEYRFLMFAEMYSNENFNPIREQFVREAETYYRHVVGSAEETSICAKRNGQTVGCGTIMYQRKPPHPRHANNTTAYILNVYVHPDYRKQGIAMRIIEALQEEARARRVRRIALHASRFGMPLYKKLGFKISENYLEFKLDT